MMASRHQRILALLRDRGSVATRELHKLLGVTTMTIWRDIQSLEELGLARRIRGGVQALSPAAGEPDFEVKAIAASAAKHRIAAAAAREFVREGDVVALEGGTTVATLIEYLPHARISIITNSLAVALKLRSIRPALPVRFIGGWISSVSGNATGPEAVRAVEKCNASVCFIGATALDGEVGPSDPNPLEIEVKRSLAAIAARTVLLIDSSKFDARSTAVTLHPRRLHALVSERQLPDHLADLFRRNDVRMIVARK